MPLFISLLRGINVAGQNKITMTELKKIYENLGLHNVITYIQSGNVLFEAHDEPPSDLRNRIETAIETHYGYAVQVLIISRKELENIEAGSPFSPEKNVYFTFLSATPQSIPEEEIRRAQAESEEVSLGETVIYLYCPEGYGRTKLSNAFFEKKLKVAATTRNRKTVRNLIERISQQERNSSS